MSSSLVRYGRDPMQECQKSDEPVPTSSTSAAPAPSLRETVGRLLITSTADGWTVAGEIDSQNAARLSEALSARPSGNVVLDIGAVSFMDSSGLQSVIDATRRLRAAGGDLTLRHPSGVVARLIEITGLQGFLHVEP